MLFTGNKFEIVLWKFISKIILACLSYWIVLQSLLKNSRPNVLCIWISSLLKLTFCLCVAEEQPFCVVLSSAPLRSWWPSLNLIIPFCQTPGACIRMSSGAKYKQTEAPSMCMRAHFISICQEEADVKQNHMLALTLNRSEGLLLSFDMWVQLDEDTCRQKVCKWYSCVVFFLLTDQRGEHQDKSAISWFAAVYQTVIKLICLVQKFWEVFFFCFVSQGVSKINCVLLLIKI